MHFLALYVLLCLLAGLLGRNSRLGFWGVAGLSFFITPPTSMFFLLFFGSRSCPERKL